WWFFLVQQLIIATAYFGAAAIKFRRRADDWLVLMVALTFATWGPSTGICGCTLARESPAWRVPGVLVQAARTSCVKPSPARAPATGPGQQLERRPQHAGSFSKDRSIRHGSASPPQD